MKMSSSNCGKRKADDVCSQKTGKKSKQDDTPAGTSCGGFLSGVNAFIIVAGIGKSRADLFRKQLAHNGGVVQDPYQAGACTHIITDEKMDLTRLCRIMKIDNPPDPKDTVVIKSLWLSACLKEKTLVQTKPFEFDVEKYLSKKAGASSVDSEGNKERNVVSSSSTSEPVPGTSNAKGKETDVQTEEDPPKLPKVGVMFATYKKKAVDDNGDASDADSDYVPSGDEEEDGKTAVAEAMAEVPGPRRPLPKGNWVCAQSSSNKQLNMNQNITDKLQALAKTYENTNDRWRALGYQKAIMVLRKHPKQITTWEEAKALPGVGERLADKIWEIVESGELRKLDELTSSEEIQSINLFSNIWGAGAHTARAWVQQGLRTLDDLHTKANLTRNQKIGLKHYDEFLDRMSREEAGQIEATVKDAVSSIDPALIAMACGSYRRGKATCGDVDVLVTHPDGKSHRGVFQKILKALHDTGFLTDDLVQQEDNGNQKKYLGVCKLPGDNTKHRRLDIIVVPYDELACALMYFTGSAHFNRSMRNLAGKMNMSLSEHALCTGVIRKGMEKLNKGTPLPTPTEESVFQYLGLKYRPPEERDH